MRYEPERFQNTDRASGRILGVFVRVLASKSASKRTLEPGPETKNPLVSQGVNWWAHKGSNLGPLPCEGNALPLSYAPGKRWVGQKRDLRSAGQGCQAGIAVIPGQPNGSARSAAR